VARAPEIKGESPLAALRPIIVVKEGITARQMQLRLVAGPLNDAGAAGKICAVMTENKRACEIHDLRRPAPGDEIRRSAARGQLTKPAPHRRLYAKRAAVAVAEPPEEAGRLHDLILVRSKE